MLIPTTANKIPVTVITGFLGSGKTTLLNRLIAEGPKAAVIINEFGATPIDQDLIQQNGMPLTMLAGGCLCCQIKGALAPTLKNLWMAWNNAVDKPFERIIIETSGIASPEPILDTLLRERWLSTHYRLQQVIAMLAIPSAVEQLQRFAEARAQVVWADVLLLTHADLANIDQTLELQQCLQTIAPATPCLQTIREPFEMSALSNIARSMFSCLPNNNPLPEHGFRSLSLYLEQPPPWPQLQTILQALLDRYPELLRIKGVIFPAGQNQPIAVQAVAGRLYPPAKLAVRPNDDRRSRLVFIVAAGIEALADELKKCLDLHLDKYAIRLH